MTARKTMRGHHRKASRDVAGAKARLPAITAAALQRKLSEIPTRDQRLDLRVSTGEKEIITALAKHYGVSVTDLLVALAELANEQLPPKSVG